MSISFDLVILIDCWELNEDWLGSDPKDHTGVCEFYKRIANRLSDYNFKNVVLASHDKWQIKNNVPATSKWLVDNIQSKNNGFDLKFRKCENIIEVFREFPEALHTGLDYNNCPNTLRILICGMSFQVCTHWRPLGVVGWIDQGQNGVFTHPDLVWHTGHPWMTKERFNIDTAIQWDIVKENSYTAMLLDDNYSASANIMHAGALTWERATEAPPEPRHL